jgi:hypothetical protein
VCTNGRRPFSTTCLRTRVPLVCKHDSISMAKAHLGIYLLPNSRCTCAAWHLDVIARVYLFRRHHARVTSTCTCESGSVIKSCKPNMMNALRQTSAIYAPRHLMAVIYNCHAFREQISCTVQPETTDMINEGSPTNRKGEADESTLRKPSQIWQRLASNREATESSGGCIITVDYGLPFGFRRGVPSCPYS